MNDQQMVQSINTIRSLSIDAVRRAKSEHPGRPLTWVAEDFTPRIVPHFPGAAVPLELPFIVWHH